MNEEQNNDLMKEFEEECNFDKDLIDSMNMDNIQLLNKIVIWNYSVKAGVTQEQFFKKKEEDVSVELADGSVQKIEAKHEKSGFPSHVHLEPYSIRYLKPDGSFEREEPWKDGWTFHIPDDTHVVKFWSAEKTKCPCYIIFDGKGLKEWFTENWEKYELRDNRPTVGRNGQKWKSAYIKVPVKDFPEEIIIKDNTVNWRKSKEHFSK